MAFTELLTEKFRPKDMERIILLNRVRQSIGDGNQIQNMIFVGAPGCGKCVAGNTIVEIRNNETKEVLKIEIKELFNI